MPTKKIAQAIADSRLIRRFRPGVSVTLLGQIAIFFHHRRQIYRQLSRIRLLHVFSDSIRSAKLLNQSPPVDGYITEDTETYQVSADLSRLQIFQHSVDVLENLILEPFFLQPIRWRFLFPKGFYYRLII